MFKVKNLAIAALLTVASVGSIYAADSSSSSSEYPADSSSTGRTVSITQISAVSQSNLSDETQEGTTSSRSRTITFRGQSYVISDLLCSAIEYLFGPRTAPALQVYFPQQRYGLKIGSASSTILTALQAHPAMKRGQDLLTSVAQQYNTIASTTGKQSTAVVLPVSYDMRSIMGAIANSSVLFPMRNQGALGSCTAHAGAGAIGFCELRDQIVAKGLSPSSVTTSNITPVNLSPLFLYYYERANDTQSGGVTVDNGANMEDIVYTLVNNGVCPETDWPYSDAKSGAFPPPYTQIPFTQQPSVTAITDAQQNIDKDIQGANLNQKNILSSVVTAQVTGSGTALLTNIKQFLAANHPVVFGVRVYSSFESSAVQKTGIIPLPGSTEKLLGGHALMLVGYNDNANYNMYKNVVSYNSRGKKVTQSQLITGYFTFRNSWGTGWGNQGYFSIPYDYITDTSLTYGIYMISKVSTTKS